MINENLDKKMMAKSVTKSTNKDFSLVAKCNSVYGTPGNWGGGGGHFHLFGLCFQKKPREKEDKL